MAWTASDGSTLWTAVSRAVRVPTRFERDIAIDITRPGGQSGRAACWATTISNPKS